MLYRCLHEAKDSCPDVHLRDLHSLSQKSMPSRWHVFSSAGHEIRLEADLRDYTELTISHWDNPMKY